MHPSVEQSLDDQICRILDWAAAVVSEARPDTGVWAATHAAPDDPHSARPLEKMLSEAALLALISHRVLGDNNPSVARLLDAIEGQKDSLDWIYEVVRQRPHLSATVGLTWMVLDHFSRGDAGRRARLRPLWRENTSHPSELLPFKWLEEVWARDIASRTADPDAHSKDFLATTYSREFFATTALANLQAGLLMRTRDLYAVTHCAMYLTDFGSIEMRRSPHPGWIEPLSLSRLLVNDFDLAAELTIAELLVAPRDPHIGATVIAGALSSVFEDLGYIPAPSISVERYEDSESQNDYLRFHSYHPTFVYALLCCVTRIVAAKGDTDRVAVLATTPKSEFRSEWDSRPPPDSEVSDRVVETFVCLSSLVSAAVREPHDAILLRSIVDGHLVNAVVNGDDADVLKLLGMVSVAGPSVIDTAARDLLSIRARLGGGDGIAAILRASGGLQASPARHT